jgi:RimJ/RimL family protein N-acetyltransferase
MNFESSRLLFQEINAADISLVHHLNSFEEVARFNTIGIPSDISKTAAMLQTILDDRDEEVRCKYLWIVRFKENQDFIGDIGLNLSKPSKSRAEFYYSILPEYWGHGYATEAVRRIIDFSFDELKLHRLSAGVAKGNLASIRVLEKAGLIKEGVGRKILPIRGKWYDNFSYSILENDPR